MSSTPEPIPARVLEDRLDCPVCPGLPMHKLQPGGQDGPLIDYCRRCGGMWFDRGEASALAKLDRKSFLKEVRLSEEARRMNCHSCEARFDRNTPVCPACGWKNQIDCPRCDKTLEVVDAQGLKIDVCRNCQGAWFDNVELAEIWNLKVRKNALARSEQGMGVTDFFIIDALLWGPDLVVWSAMGAAEVIGSAPELAAGAVEATGDVAGSVFETIAEIIGSIFGG